MATIQERKRDDGGTSYRAMVRLRGAPLQTRTFRRLTAAKKWAQQVEAAIRAGRSIPGVAARKVTLRELIEDYTASAEYRDLSLTEQGKRETQLEWWAEHFGDRLLADFGALEVKRGLRMLSDDGGASGRPLGPATVNRYRAALSVVLGGAVRDGILEANPCRRVSARREPRGRVRRLTDDERGRLLSACKAESLRLYYMVQWALWTGARQGELLGLRWADVDERKQRAVLHHTKSGDRRALVLPSPLLPIIAEQRATTRRTDTDRVFALGPRGGATFPKDQWESALEEAKIDDLRFHDLRHDFASRMADSGASLAQLAELLGHKTLSMVSRYSHLNTDALAGVVERMAAAPQ